MNEPPEIGPNIRRRRRRLGLSLDALAEQSGVSTTMLSEVERSMKNPTVKLAYQIARALGCSLTDLLSEPSPPDVALTRAKDRVELRDPDTGTVRHGVFAPLLGLEVAWYEIPARSTSGEMAPNRPGVVELLTVVEGSLTLILGGRPETVHPGDTATYAPTTTTEYRNDDADQTCRFLLLVDSTKAG